MATSEDEDKPTNVQWHKPVPGRVVPEYRVYASRCGRFTIERREYVAPCASVGWVVRDLKRGGTYDGCDTLLEAKWHCHNIVEDESGSR